MRFSSPDAMDESSAAECDVRDSALRRRRPELQYYGAGAGSFGHALVRYSSWILNPQGIAMVIRG